MTRGDLLYLAYAGCSSVLYAIACPFLHAAALLPGETGRSLRERLGLLPNGLPRGAVWVHAASVGEVIALGPLLREIVRRRPRIRLALSVMTPAGKRRARALYRFPVAQAPLDSPVPVRRWLRRAAPRALIVMETELWPVWLASACARAPVAWVNGRVSDRSYPRYRLVRPLMERIMAGFRFLCVISRTDARRATFLGASPSRIRVTGNLKVDSLRRAAPPRGMPRGRWIVAGSTRPGEEKILLEAFGLVRRRHPRACLVLAPRHPRRAGKVVLLAKAFGFEVVRRSEIPARGLMAGEADVLVLDTLGELGAFYRLGAVAFVGGTLVPVGGHNILEPAQAGLPVTFGPRIANVREHAAGLRRCGGGFSASSARALASKWSALLASARFARRAGGRARAFVRSRQGVARRVVGLLIGEGIL